MTDTSETKRLLLAARLLLDRPEHWTKNAFGRRSPDSPPTGWSNPYATCFCLMGAVRRASEQTGVSSLHATIALRTVLGNNGITCFNDDPSTTHEDVLAAIDRAITLEEASA